MATDWESALFTPFLSQQQEDEARILHSEWEAGTASSSSSAAAAHAKGNVLLGEAWSDNEDELFGGVSLSPDSGLTSHSSSSPEFLAESPPSYLPPSTTDLLADALLTDVKPLVGDLGAEKKRARMDDGDEGESRSASPSATPAPTPLAHTLALAGAVSQGGVRKDLALKPVFPSAGTAAGIAAVVASTGLVAKGIFPSPLQQQQQQQQQQQALCSGSLFLQSLSSEERVMMEAEGVAVPKEGPLSKNEERELKRLRRKIKNKLSAKDSRRRRKEYLTTLEEENEDLKRQLDEMKETSHSLARQLSCMYNYVAPSFEGKSKPHTAVMMLFMLTLTTSAAQTAAADKAVDIPSIAGTHTGILPEATSAAGAPPGKETLMPLNESFKAALKNLVATSGVLTLASDAIESSTVDALYVPHAADLRADIESSAVDGSLARFAQGIEEDLAYSRKRKSSDDEYSS